MKLTQFPEWCIDVPSNGHSKCRLISKQAEKNQLLIVNELFNLMALQHYSMQRITANQALVSPHRNKAAVLV